MRNRREFMLSGASPLKRPPQLPETKGPAVRQAKNFIDRKEARL
jgi:hypothetical protein